MRLNIFGLIVEFLFLNAHDTQKFAGFRRALFFNIPCCLCYNPFKMGFWLFGIEKEVFILYRKTFRINKTHKVFF